MSDRVCIASEGKKEMTFFPVASSVGTGKETQDACKPYEIPPCGHHKNETYYHECKDMADTPSCSSKCQKGYSKSYKSDKTFGEPMDKQGYPNVERFYSISGKGAYALPKSVSAIQRDILKNGPVVAAFTVYEDFMHYRTGIYKYTYGDEQGGHAVKIIGWGSENGVPYWIIANSWNSDWGENGFFRMIRGEDDCGIEENVVAGHV
ncbi:papain family cysteine protease [Ancylostoma duodenale]|uniref:Papain family cysteine protease n=1 Tax=Ancylostoma duodenale TaxID=51022 RepID=A0A0C2C608_9BILA|nr:papain family cysteine protease [Ancylostoma duodenale]